MAGAAGKLSLSLLDDCAVVYAPTRIVLHCYTGLLVH